MNAQELQDTGNPKHWAENLNNNVKDEQHKIIDD